mmetsp:Transcript_46138/g.153960  ORF Transcript_46138/g.153960 Transcript_46138/m.153960 type:complete len:269 (-) Transcript_46138:33-839(-)
MRPNTSAEPARPSPTPANAACMLTRLPRSPPIAGPRAIPVLRACISSAMFFVRLSGVPILTTPAMLAATMPDSATPPANRHATSCSRECTSETAPMEAPMSTRLPTRICLLPLLATTSVIGMVQRTFERKSAPLAAPKPAAVMPRWATSCGSNGTRMPNGSAVSAIPPHSWYAAGCSSFPSTVACLLNSSLSIVLDLSSSHSSMNRSVMAPRSASERPFRAAYPSNAVRTSSIERRSSMFLSSRSKASFMSASEKEPSLSEASSECAL